jgi:hypothetical protein
MSLGDALLTFVSVFVAALLAFYLDGLRERRATRAWTREYLGFWRHVLDLASGDRNTNETGLGRIEAALDTWLADSEIEPVWSDIQSVHANSAVSFTPLLLSSGASEVPQDLLAQMFVADATAPMVFRRSESVTRVFEAQVLPLVLERVVRLTPSQRRAVELYREEFVMLRDQMRVFMDQLDEIRSGLVRLGV